MKLAAVLSIVLISVTMSCGKGEHPMWGRPLNELANVLGFATLQAGTTETLNGAFEQGYDYDDDFSNAGELSGMQLVWTVGNLTEGNDSSPALKTKVATILEGYGITINATKNGSSNTTSVADQLLALPTNTRESLYSKLTTAALVDAFAVAPPTSTVPTTPIPGASQPQAATLADAFTAAFAPVPPPPAKAAAAVASFADTIPAKQLSLPGRRRKVL